MACRPSTPREWLVRLGRVVVLSLSFIECCPPSFIGCCPRHSSSVIPVIRQVSSPLFIECRPSSSVIIPPMAREARGGWCIVICHPSLSSSVVCHSPVVCHLSSPRSFVVFVVVRPWCTHNPPDEQLLVSMGVGALSIVVVIHVVVVPRCCCRSLLSFVVVVRCCCPLLLLSMLLLSPVVVVRCCCCPRPHPCPCPVLVVCPCCLSLLFVLVVCPCCLSLLFVLIVPVLVPVLIIVPPAVHPTSSCS
jgi:hypothetical protein